MQQTARTEDQRLTNHYSVRGSELPNISGNVTVMK
jgi:hypothetical protein